MPSSLLLQPPTSRLVRLGIAVDGLFGRGAMRRFVLFAARADLDQLVAANRSEINEQQQIPDGHGGRNASGDLQGLLATEVAGFFDQRVLRTVFLGELFHNRAVET